MENLFEDVLGDLFNGVLDDVLGDGQGVCLAIDALALMKWDANFEPLSMFAEVGSPNIATLDFPSEILKFFENVMSGGGILDGGGSLLDGSQFGDLFGSGGGSFPVPFSQRRQTPIAPSTPPKSRYANPYPQPGVFDDRDDDQPRFRW